MTERRHDELRPVKITRGYTEMTPGSVLMEVGRTRVLCTASISVGVPPWLRDQGRGWVTAEYAMLPGSSTERIHRGSISGGRTKEIQRLIGRSLRTVVDFEAMGESTVRLDCDVLQADGGTRTAAITGAWIALKDALDHGITEGVVAGDPLLDQVAGVSVGIVAGELQLDLDYELDAGADVDMNVVMTGVGGLVEVQGTAERKPFSRGDLTGLLDLAARGIGQLVEYQKASLA